MSGKKRYAKNCKSTDTINKFASKSYLQLVPKLSSIATGVKGCVRMKLGIDLYILISNVFYVYLNNKHTCTLINVLSVIFKCIFIVINVIINLQIKILIKMNRKIIMMKEF